MVKYNTWYIFNKKIKKKLNKMKEAINYIKTNLKIKLL